MGAGHLLIYIAIYIAGPRTQIQDLRTTRLSLAQEELVLKKQVAGASERIVVSAGTKYCLVQGSYVGGQFWIKSAGEMDAVESSRRVEGFLVEGAYVIGWPAKCMRPPAG